jgi:glucose-6-phosphate isomerase
MTHAWRWQDAACWQSCSTRAHDVATAWQQDMARHQDALISLAAMQPLVADLTVAERVMQEVAALQQYAQQLVVIGTGGASLGAQALCALAEAPAQVRFLENCDPVTMAQFMKLPRESTAWCIISKSGETVETLAATLSLVAHYSDAPELLAPRLRIITSHAHSSLGQLAAARGWQVLDHPPALGGRFSVFSVVGLLPAAFAGLDVRAMLQQASACMQHYLHAPQPEFWAQAAWLAANAAEKPMHVLMAYADRLRPSTQWFKQLLAESLGKAQRGLTPVTAIGAIDQHSQLQLYLDGPRDKLMTLWLPDMAELGTPLPSCDVPGMAYLAGHRMGAVMHATAEATVQTLTKAGVPLRVLRGTLSPASLSAWMVQQMLEILAVSVLLGVDPYSQPAVEEGKHLTRQALRSA